jgi:two-component system cell cycle response regulator DivK
VNARPALDLRGVSVLIVEDHDDTRELLRTMVASFGGVTRTARDGAEARAMVEADAPDCVFCDLLMPRVDGFQFVSWLRREPQLARIPVIAITALGARDDVMRTWAAGFSGHLVKPVGLEQVEDSLRRIFWAQREP